MGLKESGLRGSLRNVSVGIGAIPDSVTDQWPMDEGSGSTAANDVGLIDLDLFGAGWTSDSKYFGGEATTYDGTDHWFRTESEIDINGTELTVMAWVENLDPGDATPRILHSGDGDSRPDDGWEITLNDQNEWGVNHRDNGSTNNVIDDVSGPDPSNQEYFVVYRASGDNGQMLIYDDTEQVFDESGSGSRGQTSSAHISGMRGGFDNFTGGVVDAPAASTTDDMSVDDVEEYWQQHPLVT